MDHDMGTRTPEERAWEQVEQARQSLHDLVTMLGRESPQVIRFQVAAVQTRLNEALAIHSEARHTHMVTIPAMVARDSQGHAFNVAGGAIPLEDAIRAGLIQVVVLQDREGATDFQPGSRKS